MAQQTLANGASYGTQRTKINENFTELYSANTTIEARVDAAELVAANAVSEAEAATAAVDFPNAYASQQDFEIANLIQNYKHQKSFVNGLSSNPTSFTRASSATYFDANGVMQTAASGAPRYTHDPLTLQPLGFLSESQATNLVTYSDDLLNTGWTTTRASIVNNGDGWFKLTCDATSANSHFLTKSGVTKSPSTNYVKSIEAKKGGGTFGRYLYIQTNTFADWVTDGRAIFDLQDGVVVSSTLPVGSYGIQSVGGGAYKCWIMSTTEPTTTASSWQFELSDGVYSSFDGDGSSYIYLRRPQIEAGSFPTSYIPTTSAAVTRVADYMTDVVNSGTYLNGDRGTVFADFYAPYINSATSGASGRQTVWRIRASLSSGSSDYLALNHENGILRLLVFSGGVSIRSDISSVVTTQRNKVAVSYVVSGGVLTPIISLNGATVAGVTASGFSMPSPVLYVGAEGTTRQLGGTISRLNYFKRAMTQAELNEMTA